MNEVLLYSSGLDSFLVREYLLLHNHNFDCLYFNHKGRYVQNEMNLIQTLNFPVIIKDDINLKDIEKEDAFIPNRNILFSIIINSYGYEKAWIGGTRSDRVCDNNESIFNQLSSFLTTMNGKHFIITSPFWDVYKTDAVAWYLNVICKGFIEEAANNLLFKTFSCYNPKESESVQVEIKDTDINIKQTTSECLNCKACFRKNVELSSIGILRPFKNQQIISSYQQEIDFSIILNKRMKATKEYIRDLKYLKTFRI